MLLRGNEHVHTLPELRRGHQHVVRERPGSHNASAIVSCSKARHGIAIAIPLSLSLSLCGCNRNTSGRCPGSYVLAPSEWTGLCSGYALRGVERCHGSKSGDCIHAAARRHVFMHLAAACLSNTVGRARVPEVQNDQSYKSLRSPCQGCVDY